jgi:hypothetical protein
MMLFDALLAMKKLMRRQLLGKERRYCSEKTKLEEKDKSSKCVRHVVFCAHSKGCQLALFVCSEQPY